MRSYIVTSQESSVDPQSRYFSLPPLADQSLSITKRLLIPPLGLLFKTKDYHSLSNNIEKLYCSKDLRKKLSINADMFATERYNYDNHFKRLQELISNL